MKNYGKVELLCNLIFSTAVVVIRARKVLLTTDFPLYQKKAKMNEKLFNDWTDQVST